MGMGMLLIICAIASSFLLLASSSSGYSLSPSSAVIPPISSGTSSSNTFPTTSPWPNGKGLNPAAVSPPLKSDTAPQTMRGPSTSVLPSGPTTVPSNDFSPLPTTRQDTVPSPPPINSQGPVQVSLPNGLLSRPPSTKHPVLAPESSVQDESPSMKSPPTMQPVVTIAPAPVEPTLRESQKNPPTMQPIVAGFMPPRPHENGSPDTALPMPVPLAPFERPSKKSSQIPPIRQPVGIGSSPPTPHENGPPDTPIAVPIAPATAEPPLRELPQSPTTMQPVVTGSFPPSPYRNRAPYTPQSPPAMPPLVMGSTPPIPPENGSTDTPVSMPIAPGTSATEQNRKQNNIPSDHSMNPAVSPSTPAVPVSSPPSKFIGHTPPIHQRFPEEPPSSSPGKKVRQLQDKSPSMKSPPTMQPVVTIAPAPVEPTLRVAPQNPPTMQPVVAGSMPPRPHENGSPDTALPMPVPLAPVEPPSKKSSQVPPIRQPDGIGSSPPTPHENRPPDTPITTPIGPATAEPPLTELPQSPPTRQPVMTASLPPSPYRNRTPDTPQSPPAMPPLVMGSTQPSPHENGSTDTPLPMPIAPGTSATEQNRKRNNTLPGHSMNSAVSPSTPAVPVASPPSKFLGHTSPNHQRLPEEPPSSSPGKRVRQFKHNVSHVSTPPPSINGERVARPVAEPPYRMANRDVNAHTSPAKAPSTHKNMRHSSNAASPHHSPNFTPDKGFGTPSYSPSALPMKHHFVNENTTLAPLSHSVPPPASTSQGALIAPVPSFYSYSDPKSTLRHHAHPPLNSGPLPSNEISPSGSSARTPKMLLPHPFTLPPPPPNGDCSSLTCMEPFTSPPPNSSCVCALPMQIGLSLSVALYTFFPLVSELAYEIAAGVSMDSSQVRIMGANAANQYPEKTVVFIDLVPLGGQFDNTTSFLIFQKFWHKDMVINASYFGDYDVIYVRYPGLPPSPPSAPSNVGIIGSDPYSGDNGRTIHPLGVDVTRKRHRDGPNRSLVAVIVLSASVAVILCCAVAWLLLFKHRDRVCQSQPTPPATIPSLGKSPGTAASVIGSGPHSAPLSFSSSFAAYTGSAKTFSLTEIERVTDNFNETRVLGEGGFGRVYSGTLEDGTKVAVKVLKRDDHQGGREFLAEVEMLSRLHHRNLVKLIGICLEGRARCLVYELVPNGSVESHLHGVDKETTPLDWDARVKIALGAARGLAYLHEDSSPRVIHRDFKSSNILLEHDFTPKVSDFGLARTAFDEENRHISTRVMGTFGYVAPEYAMTGHLLVKSDVYSYGVVLLELLTGRKPVDMSLPPGQENLVSWARQFLTTKEGLEFIVDPSLGPDFPVDSITKVAAIASMCVQPEVSHRPFMGEVVQALKLVCSETKELESQENPSADVDARFSTASGCGLDPLHACSPCASSDCELDLERGHSMADLLSPSMRYGIREYGIHSRSGTLRTGRARRLWRKMRRLSGGSMSEHGVVFRLWPASN